MKKSIIILTISLVAFMFGCRKERSEKTDKYEVNGIRMAVNDSWVVTEGSMNAPKKNKGPMDGWYGQTVLMAYGITDGTGSTPVLNYHPTAWNDPTAPDQVPWGNNDAFGIQSNNDLAKQPYVLKGIVAKNTGLTVFTPSLFYPSPHWIYLRGFYPAEGIHPGFNPTDAWGNPSLNTNTPGKAQVFWHIDGTQDIMVSNIVSGRIDVPVVGPVNDSYSFETRYDATNHLDHPEAQLEYYHLLTRLTITVKASDGSFPTLFKIKSVQLFHIYTLLSIDLNQYGSLDYQTGFPQNTNTSLMDITADPSQIEDPVFELPTPESINMAAKSVANLMFAPSSINGYYHILLTLVDDNGDTYPVALNNFSPTDITDGNPSRMLKGRRYMLNVTLGMVQGKIITHALWNEVDWGTSPGVGSPGDIGNLNPDENRWW